MCFDNMSYLMLAKSKGGSTKLKKTGGGKPVELDATEIAVFNAYKGKVKMTGIPGVNETGKMKKYISKLMVHIRNNYLFSTT